MSASSKKKLRHAEAAAKLTERQLQEQKEAKKLNLYTTLFVTVLVLLLVAAIAVGTVNFVKGSGIRERNTTAATIGNHEVSNAELNYYYVDAINNFLSYYGDYVSLVGLDTTTPLNEQVLNTETGATWADDFLTQAKENARAVYAMVDAAEAEGYTLTDEQAAQVDSVVSNMEAYALLYGFTDVESYLKGMYGSGASIESYKDYCYNSILADAYYTDYVAALTYSDEELRAFEAEDYHAYTSYSYNYYYLSASKFQEGGTTDEEGNTTYSDEEKAAAVEAAEEAAKTLTAETVTDVKILDKLIGDLSINAESETAVTSIACDDYLRGSVLSIMSDWVTAEDRVAGEMTYIPSTSTSTDEDGNETVTTNGYYVVFFRGTNDNKFPLIDARHILVGFEGGTYDESTGVTTYTDEEKQAAWTEAEEILASWKAGEATEDSFAALANEKSDDTGSNTNGGLYTYIYPGQMVATFEDWCYDTHTAGDTGLVETDYGVHIMYYVGESDTTYRDYMITSELMEQDTEAWYNGLLESVTVTDGNAKYIRMDMVISSN